MKNIKDIPAFEPGAPWNAGIPPAQLGDFQARKFEEGFYILRQCRDAHYESPFLFLILGQRYAILQDSGAESSNNVSLISLVKAILQLESSSAVGAQHRKLVVYHSHSHDDHVAGDSNFRDAGIDLIPPSLDEMAQYFDTQIDDGFCTIDLGGRTLTIFSIPGHDKTSVAVFDRKTSTLLTGDTFYPGRLFVENWGAFKQSISLLFNFSQTMRVRFILGNHVEMSMIPFDEYPEGCKEQPNERPLALNLSDLEELNSLAASISDLNNRIKKAKFVLVPS